MVGPPARLGDQVADAVSAGLFVTTADGAVVWANVALRALLDVAGAPLPAVRAALVALPVADLTPGEVREVTWSDAGGRAHRLRMSCRPLPAASAVLYEILDVTAEHIDIERGRNREWRLSRIEALARVGTWEWEIATNRMVWSDELLRTFGFADGVELDYVTYRSLLHPDDVPLIEETLAEALRTAEPFSYTHRMYLADRVTLRIFDCYGEVLTDESGAPVRILGTAQDVTDTRRVQEELAYLADHDPLTGLANRRAVLYRLADHLDTGDPGALLLLDVDNFKDVNDQRGHAVGDTVLRGARQATA